MAAALKSLPSRYVADLVGSPYRIGGRGPTHFDCAGLVMEVQRRLGRPDSIPGTGETHLGDHLSMRRVLQAEWEERSTPEPGCIVFWPTDAHVGTMIDRRRFLHTSQLVGEAVIEQLDHPLWIRKRRKFYVQRGQHEG